MQHAPVCLVKKVGDDHRRDDEETDEDADSDADGDGKGDAAGGGSAGGDGGDGAEEVSADEMDALLVRAAPLTSVH